MPGRPVAKGLTISFKPWTSFIETELFSVLWHPNPCKFLGKSGIQEKEGLEKFKSEDKCTPLHRKEMNRIISK